LTKRIIPCLDVTEGRVVKGTSFTNLRDAGDPIELAIRYYEEGADELTFLDIGATPECRGIMADVVKEVAKQVFIPLTVGGGLRTIEDMQRLLERGADKVSINTAAVYCPDLIAEAARKFGSQCIVVAIDARRVRNRPEPAWEVYTHSGQVPTGKDAVQWAKTATDLGAGEILLTSWDADGHKAGYDLELTRAVGDAVRVPIVASGGAGNLEHLYQALTVGKADAVLAASIFHYGMYSISEAKDYLKGKGIPVRTDT